jgi:thiol:disulfide interchange protein DsbD
VSTDAGTLAGVTGVSLPVASWLTSFENWIGGISAQLAEAFQGASDPLALTLCFLAGVLTSLTPCVYPMIPIVVAYMGGAESAAMSSGSPASGRRRRVVVRSAFYVVGMAIVYTILGLVGILLGRTFGALTQSAWGYGLVAAVLIVFGLSMIGLFEVRVPSFILDRVGTGPREGNFGALVMGATSGIVAAPCAAPIVFPIIAVISTQGRVIFGTIAMLAFSLGLGLLLFLIGISSGLAASLPRSGPWMVTLKKVLGVLLIAMGLWFTFLIVRPWFY